MKYSMLHRRHHRALCGFSLVEVLVYLGVTILVAVAGVTTFLTLDMTLLRNETERALTHEASVALERMVREIRAADSVSVGLSAFGTSPGTLTLISAGTTTTFSMSGSNLNLAINGISQGQLTGDAVAVDSVVFTRYANAETELVRVTLTLSVSNRAASSTRTFYTSAIPRGSYE